jgi:uncharacterized membrane protein
MMTLHRLKLNEHPLKGSHNITFGFQDTHNLELGITLLIVSD